jgi:hypothetical protein
VDAAPNQSASLIAKNEDLGDDAITPHEDTFSAAPAVPNFEKPSQPQSQAQPSQSASLTVENQAPSKESKTPHEAIGSAASVPQPEKWSSEAIAARSKARPWRMEKIKTAEVLKQNPGFDFLLECWQDDPALQIVIKKLLAKFPQWKITIVEGMLRR